MREVVHVETQGQYDYVTEKLNYNWNGNKWLDERENTCIRLDEELYSSIIYHKKYGNVKVISFEEFKSRYEPQLKIGDTFEKDGFVCRVESEVEEKKWYYNTRTDKYVRTKHYGKHLTEITNKEFIKQLEKYSK